MRSDQNQWRAGLVSTAKTKVSTTYKPVQTSTNTKYDKVGRMQEINTTFVKTDKVKRVPVNSKKTTKNVQHKDDRTHVPKCMT